MEHDGIPVVGLDQLRRLCQKYDQLHGSYPEHPLEGWALWQFIEGTLAGVAPTDDLNEPEGWYSGEEA